MTKEIKNWVNSLGPPKPVIRRLLKSRAIQRKIQVFTLLEVMIALLVLVLMGSVITFQVKKLIDLHQFEKEIGTFFSSLQEAQVLSITYQTDISLNFFLKNGHPAYRFFTDEPSLSLNQEEVVLSHATSCKFNGKKVTSGHFDLYSGRCEPRGRLSFEQDKKVLWVDLQYGHLLKFSHQEPPLSKLQIPKGLG